MAAVVQASLSNVFSICQMNACLHCVPNFASNIFVNFFLLVSCLDFRFSFSLVSPSSVV